MSLSPTAKRFWSMILCGIAAAALFGLMQPLFHTDFMEFILKWLGALGGTPLVASFVVAGSIWAGKAAYNRRRGFLGLRYFFKFPPLWLAVGVTLASLYGIDWLIYDFAVRNEMCASISWWIWDDLCQYDFKARALAAVMVVLFLWFLLLCEQDWTRPWFETTTADSDEPADNSVHLNELAQDVDKLIEWFEDDTPIMDPNQDAFGHRYIAKRIADRLSTLESEKVNASHISTALLGRVGSGKSSILKMVLRRVQGGPQAQKKFVIVGISMWPYTDVEAVVRHVIKSVTKELGKHVNVRGLSGISRRYLRAIQSTGGYSAAVGHLLDAEVTPQEALAKLNQAAQAIGLTVVVWIEDQERFVTHLGEDPAGAISSRSEDVYRLAPLHALLHLLDECDQIGVVWADSDTGIGIDRHKITRYTDLVPRPELNLTWRLVACLRDNCLPGQRFSYVDSASQMERSDLLATGDGTSTKMVMSLIDELKVRSIPDCVCELLDSPRRLKDALRLFYSDWTKLYGECDIDHLLVLSVLKSYSRELESFIKKNTEALRDGLKSPRADAPNQGDKSDKRKTASELLEGYLLYSTQSQKEAIYEILMWMFPKHSGRGSSDVRPQGFQVRSPRDYLSYAWFAESPKGRLDQPILSAIREWRATRPNDLLKIINQTAGAKSVAHFANSFDAEDLTRLLDDVLENKPMPFHDSWSGKGYPAIGAIHHAMGILRPDEDAIVPVVESHIKRLVPRDLALAQEVEQTFSTISSAKNLIDHNGRAQIRSIFVDSLRDSYGKGKQIDLVEALRDESSYLLSWSIWGLDRLRANDDASVPFEDWEGFARSIVAATVKDSAIMLSPVATLMAYSDKGDTEWEGHFVKKRAKLLFTDDQLGKLMKLFIANKMPQSLAGSERAEYEAVAIVAEFWPKDPPKDLDKKW